MFDLEEKPVRIVMSKNPLPVVLCIAKNVPKTDGKLCSCLKAANARLKRNKRLARRLIKECSGLKTVSFLTLNRIKSDIG